jgi:5-methyltetrahydrofolate--homocysteine methyltransferase
MEGRVTKQELVKRMNSRILILDGAMGTMLQKYNLDPTDFRGGAGNNDILNITRPDVIEKIHREYIEAGADIIETNTFSSTSISQQEYNCEDLVYELNRKGAEIARKAAQGTDVLVAGSMGPTIKMLTFSPDVNRPEFRPVDFDTMANAYMEQVRGLLDGGVDLLLVETVYDGLNAKAALYAISKVQQQRGTEVPVMVSATINDRSGRLLSGQRPDALYTLLSHYNIVSFGLNCSFGAAELLPFMEQLAGEVFGGNGVPCALSMYPNAGLPNELGQYDETPEFTAKCIKEVALKGLLNIAGGCCGTTPAHIRAIREALEGIAPRPVALPSEDLWVSGLENLLINKDKNNFINVGERTNVAGSAKFARLIREKQYAEAADIARKQIEDGATIIDINMDDAMLNSAQEMATFIRYINNDPDIAKVPFMIDSSDWDTILAGLKSCTGKCIVNSLSLKEGEEEFVRKASEIYLLGAAVIVMAFDEQGQAVTYQRKIEICGRAYKILTEKVGFAPQDIIFDVNILTIATGLEEHNAYAVDYIKAVEWIKKNLPGCKTSRGV